MPDLVDAERIAVDHLRGRQVLPDRVQIGAVDVRIEDKPVEYIQGRDESGDLEGGDVVAVALAGLPRQRLGANGLLGESSGRREEDEREHAGQERPAARA